MKPFNLGICKLVAMGVLGVAFTAGCSNIGGPTATEQDFGNSVRQMVRAQTLNPGAADDIPVESSDPQRLEKVLDTHREDVARPEGVSRDPTADIFGPGGQ